MLSKENNGMKQVILFLFLSASLPASETASENTENIDEEHTNCCQACW